MFKVTTNAGQVAVDFGQFARELPRLAARALNYGAARGRTFANREISATYAIGSREVGNHIKVEKTDASKLQAAIVAHPVRPGRAGVNLVRYVQIGKGRKASKPGKPDPAGVPVTIRKGRVTRVSKSWIMTAGGNTFVARRDPGKGVTGVRAGWVREHFGTKGVSEKVAQHAGEMAVKEMKRLIEVDWNKRKR